MERQVSRPAWMEIDLDAIVYNMRSIKNLVGRDVAVMPVVKADAYGHGAVEIVKEYHDMGIEKVAVATLSEAIMLKKGLGQRSVDMLILGYTPPYLVDETIKLDIGMTVYSYDQAKRISDAAVVMGKTATVHIKIETGLNRLGFDPVEANIEEIAKVAQLPNLYLEGIFTHFAAADENEVYTRRQAALFEKMVGGLEKRGVIFRYRHAANSAATIAYPEFRYDMVRPGLINYGIYPNNTEEERAIIALQPALTLKAEVVHLKTLMPGDKVSYGLTFTAPHKMELATIPIGYADGYNRALGNKSKLLVHGHPCAVVGKICMDHLMADVSDAQVAVGDIVTLVGTDGDEEINMYDVAALVPGQIPHSLISMFTKRLPRVYTKQGEEILCRDYILDLAKQLAVENGEEND